MSVLDTNHTDCSGSFIQYTYSRDCSGSFIQYTNSRDCSGSFIQYTIIQGIVLVRLYSTLIQGIDCLFYKPIKGNVIFYSNLLDLSNEIYFILICNQSRCYNLVSFI